jgi:hypothetical protein
MSLPFLLFGENPIGLALKEGLAHHCRTMR